MRKSTFVMYRNWERMKHRQVRNVVATECHQSSFPCPSLSKSTYRNSRTHLSNYWNFPVYVERYVLAQHFCWKYIWGRQPDINSLRGLMQAWINHQRWIISWVQYWFSFPDAIAIMIVNGYELPVKRAVGMVGLRCGSCILMQTWFLLLSDFRSILCGALHG